MVLQQKYQTQPSAIASFDSTDLAEGTGIVIYNGAKDQSGYILTRNQVYSDNVNDGTDQQGITTISALTTSNSFVQMLDLDFDLVFNVPRIINGKFYANLPLGSIATEQREWYAIVTIKHYDGTTETVIGTVQSATNLNGGGSTGSEMSLVSVDLTKKQFKATDILRITVEVWGKVSGAVNLYVGLGHDPKNRNDPNTTFKTIEDGDDTTLLFYVPFVIDV